MADNGSETNGVPLPPKLDLKKDFLKAQMKPKDGGQAAEPPKAAAAAASPQQAAQSAPAAPSIPSAPKPPAAAPAASSGIVIKPPAPAQGSGPAAAAPTIQIKKPAAGPAPAGPAAVPRPAPAQQQVSSTTMRLEVPAQEAKPLNEAPTIVVSKPAGQSAAQAQVPGQPAGQPGVPASKSKTTRIPLEMATPGAGATPGKPTQDLKTIKIKPVSGAPVGKLSSPLVPGPGEKAADEKRKTSRISLEAALGASGVKGAAPSGAGETPKTIKLKRPGEPPAVDLAGPETAKALGRTTKLEEMPAEEEGPTPTRRKTIKLKRPTDHPGAPVASVARAEETAEAAAEEEAPSGAAAVFDAIALVAAIMLIVSSLIVAYLFCAQAFGPNVSLTQLSYGAPGLDLGWPGKLPSVMR